MQAARLERGELKSRGCSALLTVLSGGVGGSKFIDGLARVVGDEELRVIVNTGDDEEFFGLHVSPDVDILLYTLAGIVDVEKGWGISGDTFNCLEALGRLGLETWFKIGDKDLATHLFRTLRLREGARLSDVVKELAERLGVKQRVIPMSDDPVRTYIETEEGVLTFQRYFVERGARVAVKAIKYIGADSAKPAEGVVESLLESRAVIIAPSNPFLSIGPILAIRSVREALRKTAAITVAVSPLVGGKALKGPADKLMVELGYEPSSRGVASLYKDFLKVMVIDEVDRALCESIERMGIRCFSTDTVMRNVEDRKRLARFVLKVIDSFG